MFAVQGDVSVGVDPFEGQFVVRMTVLCSGDGEISRIEVVAVGDPLYFGIVIVQKRVRNVAVCEEIQVHSCRDACLVDLLFESWRSSRVKHLHRPVFVKKGLVVLCA